MHVHEYINFEYHAQCFVETFQYELIFREFPEVHTLSSQSLMMMKITSLIWIHIHQQNCQTVMKHSPCHQYDYNNRVLLVYKGYQCVCWQFVGG